MAQKGFNMGAIKATVGIIAESQSSELSHPIDFLKQTGVLTATEQTNYYLAIAFICRMCPDSDGVGGSTISSDWRIIAARAIYTTPKILTQQTGERTLLREAKRSDAYLRDVLARMREAHPEYIEQFVNEIRVMPNGAKALAAWFLLPDPVEGAPAPAEIPAGGISISGVPPTGWTTSKAFLTGSKWVIDELIHSFVSSDGICPIKATLASPFYLFLLSFVKRGGSLEKVGTKLARRIPELTVIFQDITTNHSLSKECYARVGNLVTDSDVSEIFASVTKDVNHGGMPLDVVNVVNWAKNSMMTGTMLAITALRDYSDFNWAKISEIFPKEATRLMTASETMVNDPYIGFKKERHGVSQRLYRNFVYVAFQLHTSLGDQPDLRFLKGIPEAPSKHPELIKELIKEYIVLKDTAMSGTTDEKIVELSKDMVTRMKEIMTVVDSGRQGIDVSSSVDTLGDL